MDQRLLDHLICPACLPVELGLLCRPEEEDGPDIITGHLHCGGCGRDYPIEEGIAVLLPESLSQPENNRYEEAATVASYLWSHYGDLLADPDATTAYADWAGLLPTSGSLALDVGCAVGRFTFELAAGGGQAIGIDRSYAFIRQARQLSRGGRLGFSLPMEGELVQQRQLRLPPQWEGAQVEFLVADASALPFRGDTFARLSSLNLLDKVYDPLGHLEQIDRVASRKDATLLVSDPFSWSPQCSPPHKWLGGRPSGPFAGRGLDNLRDLLQGRGDHLSNWQIDSEGQKWWKIRSHANHFELIRSEYLVASR